jgi:hypothetical protein
MTDVADSKTPDRMSSVRHSKHRDAEERAAVKAAEEHQKHIEILEKYYGKYERKIKRNERAMKKPLVLETPGFEGTAIPEDLHKLWMKDLILINAHDNVRRTLPQHKQNLEQLSTDIDKLKAGRPTDEISPSSRATLYTRKWGMGRDWKTVMNQAGGLWY